MPVVLLPDRIVVSVAGPDAEHLLQNLVTTDLDKLEPGQAKPGALLTPQGKILFDFLVSRRGADGFWLDIRRDVVDDFTRRLMLYKLRAKAEIAKLEQVLVAAGWQDDSDSSDIDSTTSDIDSIVLMDTRFKTSSVGLLYLNGAAADLHEDKAAYTLLRIANGVVESGADYELSDAFPHDVLLDQLDGIGFSKGCYVGQEVVSRMKHRGTARRRVLLAKAATDLPPAGADVTVGGRSIGSLGSTYGSSGLAIVRIDKVKAAIDSDQPILVGETEIELSIPGWASFTFPADTGPAETPRFETGEDA